MALLPSSCRTAIQGCTTPNGFNRPLSGRAFALAHRLQQLRGANTERVRECLQSGESRIVAASLDIAHVGPPEPRFMGELILRPLRDFPESPDVRAQ